MAYSTRPDQASIASASASTLQTDPEKRPGRSGPPQASAHDTAAVSAAPSSAPERHQTTANNAAGAELEKAQTYDPDFEVAWNGPDDRDNPRSMSNARKWLIVWIVSSTSTCVTCTSSLYTSTYAQIEDEFGCSRIVATLGLSLFVMALGISPMLLAPLSEFYGRRNVYIVSLALFLIWFAPCAAAMNIQTLLVGRFFNGLCGAAFLSVAGGTVGDMFTRDTLQAPMMVFTASPL